MTCNQDKNVCRNYLCTGTLALLLLILTASVQPACSQNYLSLGGRAWGISFGNPGLYSGIKLNAIDLQPGYEMNGINVTLYSRVCRTNGLQLSVVSAANIPETPSRIRQRYCAASGVKISLLNRGGNFNGCQAGLFNDCNEYLGNGLLCGVINAHTGSADEFSLQNGVAIGFLNFGLLCRGVQLGIFNLRSRSAVSVGFINYERSSSFQLGFINIVEEPGGVQVGAINIRRSNAPFARMLPLMNRSW